MAMPLSGQSTCSQDSQRNVDKKISLIIQKTIDHAKFKTDDCVEAVTMPVLPSPDDVRDVERCGDRAVQSLSTYVRSHKAVEQQVVLRFLENFKSDLTFEVVSSFANVGEPKSTRVQAFGVLFGVPTGKLKPILKQARDSDPDPAIRSLCARLLR
jgi:hypothetical protein